MTVAKCFSGELFSIETNGLKKSQLLRIKTKNVPDECHLLFKVMKDDVNTRTNDLFAKTEGAEEKLQGLHLEYEGLRREVETLKYVRQALGEDVNNAVKKLDEIE